MKNLLLAIVFVLAPVLSWAAGSATEPDCERGNGTSLRECSFTYTADAADGSFPEVLLKGVIGGYITSVCIDEGSTATDGTINVLVKKHGTNINYLGSQGTDVTTGGANGFACMKPYDWKDEGYPAGQNSQMSIQITGNTVNSANPTVYIIIDPAK